MECSYTMYAYMYLMYICNICSRYIAGICIYIIIIYEELRYTKCIYMYKMMDIYTV